MSFINLSFAKGIPFKILIVGLILALCLLSVPVAAAITYVDCSASRSGLTDTSQLNISQTAAVDNLLLAQIAVNGGSATTIYKPDENWTLINRRDGYGVAQALYYKRVQDTTPTTYTWKFTGGATSPKEVGTISEFSGIDWTTGPIFGVTSANSGYYGDQDPAAPQILAVPAGSGLVACYGTGYYVPSFTKPTTMNYMCNYSYPSSPLGVSCAAYNESWSTTGNTGIRTIHLQSSTTWVAQLVALRSFTECTAPSITTPPMSNTVCVGSPVTFSVCATGTEPLSYQWQKNGVNIPGATKRNLTINQVVLIDGGNYTVNVSNSCGYVVSSPVATLTIKTVCISGYKSSTYNYGLPGWTIYLNGTTVNGVIVPQKTTTTDATGYYQFCGLDPGTYFLREQLKAAEWTQVLAPGVVNLGCDNVTNQNFTNKPINFYCTGTPYVKFTYTRLSSPAHTIQFTDTSTGPFAVKWNWKFGDGTPNSYEENPKHTYARAGTYTVTLGIKWVDCSGTVVSSTWKTTSKTITVP